MNDRVEHLKMDDPGERLDRALTARLPNLSRANIQRLIDDGRVELDGKVITRPAFKLAGGETVLVRVPPRPPATALPENIPLDILYEDANLIVLNKPAGLVVHPAAGHASGTLVNALLAHAPEIEDLADDVGATVTPGTCVRGRCGRPVNGPPRPGIVHRLDKDTSGLMVVAKNDVTLRALQAQFHDREVEKVYLALVDGAPPTPTGRVETPIGRDTAQRKRMAVVSKAKGREAVTDYKTLESFAEHTLLEARPRTGRTHQIRVHMAYLKCPIAGDAVYGRRKATLPGLARHFLHATRLTFALPGESQPRTFEAKLPDELERVLVYLRRSE